MPDRRASDLVERECRVFTRYLAGEAASPYIVAAYRRLRPTLPAILAPQPRIDRLLLGWARWHPAATRIADAYSRLIRPQSTLRQSLILVLAILEHSPSSHTWFDTAAVGSRLRLGWEVARAGLASTAALLAGVLLLGPAHLATLAADRIAPNAEPDRR